MKKIYSLIIVLVLIAVKSYSQLDSATFKLSQPGPIPKGTINAPILKIKLSIGAVPVVLDSLTWNTTGCTNFLSDVALFSPKFFFTDTSNYFADTFPFFNVTFSSGGFNKFIFPITLNQGENYLWLTYDVSNTATPGNCLGALIDSLYFEGGLTVSPVFVPDTFTCIEIGNAQTSATNDHSYLSYKTNLYPNPTNGIFKIDFPLLQNKTGTLKIYDSMGNIVFQIHAALMNENTYDFSWLPNGIYTVQLTANRNVYTIKLAKL